MLKFNANFLHDRSRRFDKTGGTVKKAAPIPTKRIRQMLGRQYNQNRSDNTRGCINDLGGVGFFKNQNADKNGRQRLQRAENRRHRRPDSLNRADQGQIRNDG